MTLDPLLGRNFVLFERDQERSLSAKKLFKAIGMLGNADEKALAAKIVIDLQKGAYRGALKKRLEKVEGNAVMNGFKKLALHIIRPFASLFFSAMIKRYGISSLAKKAHSGTVPQQRSSGTGRRVQFNLDRNKERVFELEDEIDESGRVLLERRFTRHGSRTNSTGGRKVSESFLHGERWKQITENDARSAHRWAKLIHDISEEGLEDIDASALSEREKRLLTRKLHSFKEALNSESFSSRRYQQVSATDRLDCAEYEASLIDQKLRELSQQNPHLAPSVATDSCDELSSASIQEQHPMERKIPPVSIWDTARYERRGGKQVRVSVHGSGKMYCDEEIITVHQVVRKRPLEEDAVPAGGRKRRALFTPGKTVYAEYTVNEKAIIQQQATRGCTAGATAMLIVDNGKMPNMRQLLCRNLADKSRMMQDIRDAGLHPVAKKLRCSEDMRGNLELLRARIRKHGSAIVSVSGYIGGHVVVVDDISGDFSNVRLRDPYHGWEITVGADTFYRSWDRGEEIIQVKAASSMARAG